MSPLAPPPRRAPRRRLATVLGLAAAALCAGALLAGCGDDSDDGAAATDGGQTGQVQAPEVGHINEYALPEIEKPDRAYRIVLLQAHRSDAFAISAARAVQEYAKELGAEVTVNDAGGYQNVPKQIDQIEAAILQKPDALVVWATDPTAVVPALKKAEDAGIEVIGFVQPPDMPLKMTVTGDFSLDGETMASALFRKMGGEGKAIVVLGGAGSAYQSSLQEGMERALAEFPGIDVVATQTIPDFDPSKVQAAVETQLVRHPDLAGVMTTTTAMAAAASDALAAGGRAGEAFAVGQILGDCDQIRLLQEDRLAIVLGVPAVYYGRLVVANTISLLEGGSPDELTVVPGNVYTPANIDEAPLDLEIDAEFRASCSAG
ncbi:MAG: sugar ABC transporter substrate-binding protein [Thermoleophilia bacterium]